MSIAEIQMSSVIMVDIIPVVNYMRYYLELLYTAVHWYDVFRNK